jgi:sugar lactone lactonase YvrE
MFRRSYARVVLYCLLVSLPAAGFSADLKLTRFDTNGTLFWTNALVPGVCTVEKADAVDGPWLPARNAFATTSAGSLTVPRQAPASFFRLKSVDVSPTPEGFQNLVYSYGLLETIAGTGVGQTDGVSYWQPSFEGAYGAGAALSRPHFAQADRAGNIYIADKNSHAILKVTPDGNIHTFAGTHVGGFNGEGPAEATELQLNLPNGEYVRADGTVYVLDTENGRVRRVNTSGIMQTLFQTTSSGSLAGGRGLWVNETETLAYFCAGTRLRKWTPLSGRQDVATGFIELGPLYVESSGNILVCDRGANLAYRITPAGALTVIAGNGLTTGGGDGYPALETGLYGVRSIWPVPTGGFLLLTHNGCQLWYMDTAGIIHLMLNGARGSTHAGDGQFYYTPSPAISEGRSVTMDYEGNILITESDWGYVRRIRFLPWVF